MRLSSSACSPEAIKRFVSGAISLAELAELETHLNDCAQCNAKLNEATAPIKLWHDTRTFLQDAELSSAWEA